MPEKLQKILIMFVSLLTTEQRLKQFNWVLAYLSITDCVESLFFGHPVGKSNLG